MVQVPLSNKQLTLKHLRDLISDMYASKKKHDEKNLDSH